ncbi:hypothetical protein VTO42DRAFT_5001 [Malbranchea cinnamomea]
MGQVRGGRGEVRVQRGRDHRTGENERTRQRRERRELSPGRAKGGCQNLKYDRDDRLRPPASDDDAKTADPCPPGWHAADWPNRDASRPFPAWLPHPVRNFSLLRPAKMLFLSRVTTVLSLCTDNAATPALRNTTEGTLAQKLRPSTRRKQ